MQSTEYKAAMAACLHQIQQEDEGGEERGRLMRNLIRCLREDISPRQRAVLVLYYGKRMSQPQIAAHLGVNKSTVSRTIKRGERKLQRCLRYGAQRYLMSLDHETGKEF